MKIGGWYYQVIFAAGLLLAGAACLGIGVGIPAYATYREFQPYFISKENVVNLGNRGVVLLDRNEQPFFTLYQPRLITYVGLHDIAPTLRQAAVAMEDHRFQYHPGVSWRATVRAAGTDIRYQKLLQGGSTITQQLVKNSLLSREKSFSRKFKEVVLALALERHFTKSEILEMYLNTAYFGQGMVGVENAAAHYFGKTAREISPNEAYFLVTLLPSPSALLANEERLQERQELVVTRLKGLGLLSDHAVAQVSPIQIKKQPAGEVAQRSGTHFALMVKDELVRRFGEDALVQSGFTVKTTLDLVKQGQAEEIVRQEVNRLARSRVHNGAAVVLDPREGDVLALVGSRDWNDERWGQVNMATAPRQTGSAFKPIVYAAAFEEGIASPATILQDRPTTFGKDYEPANYDKRFRGPVTVRRALANSLNVPAVALMSEVGVGTVLAQAQALGLTALAEADEYNLALALGAGEVPLLQLTSAYGVLANEGEHVVPRLILEIRDKVGKPVEVARGAPVRALSRGAAFLTTSILSDDRSRREVFGSALAFPRPAAVKTGTTQAYRDAWTVGFTPQVVVGVWVGNNDNASMQEVAGALGAAPIWKKLLTLFTQDLPREEFRPPAEVITARACGRAEYFLPGMTIPRNCPWPKPSPAPIAIAEEAPKKPEKPKRLEVQNISKADDEWEEVAQWELEEWSNDQRHN